MPPASALPGCWQALIGGAGRSWQGENCPAAHLPLPGAVGTAGDAAARFAALEAKAGDQYALGLQSPVPAGWEYTHKTGDPDKGKGLSPPQKKTLCIWFFARYNTG